MTADRIMVVQVCKYNISVAPIDRALVIIFVTILLRGVLFVIRVCSDLKVLFARE